MCYKNDLLEEHAHTHTQLVTIADIILYECKENTSHEFSLKKTETFEGSANAFYNVDNLVEMVLIINCVLDVASQCYVAAKITSRAVPTTVHFEYSLRTHGKNAVIVWDYE